MHSMIRYTRLELNLMGIDIKLHHQCISKFVNYILSNQRSLSYLCFRGDDGTVMRTIINYCKSTSSVNNNMPIFECIKMDFPE